LSKYDQCLLEKMITQKLANYMEPGYNSLSDKDKKNVEAMILLDDFGSLMKYGTSLIGQYGPKVMDWIGEKWTSWKGN
jgi:uncharacterized protein with GYD domain